MADSLRLKKHTTTINNFNISIIIKTKCYEIQNEMRLGSQVIYQNEM